MSISAPRQLQPLIQSAYARKIFWYVISLVVALLIVRYLFQLFGVSIHANAMQFIVLLTDPLLFARKLIPWQTVQGSTVYEWCTLLHAIFYWGVATALDYFFFQPRK